MALLLNVYVLVQPGEGAVIGGATVPAPGTVMAAAGGPSLMAAVGAVGAVLQPVAAAAAALASAVVGPPMPSIRTHASPNARAKCQLCRLKIPKGAWRIQREVDDMYSGHCESELCALCSWA